MRARNPRINKKIKNSYLVSTLFSTTPDPIFIAAVLYPTMSKRFLQQPNRPSDSTCSLPVYLDGRPRCLLHVRYMPVLFVLPNRYSLAALWPNPTAGIPPPRLPIHVHGFSRLAGISSRRRRSTCYATNESSSSPSSPPPSAQPHVIPARGVSFAAGSAPLDTSLTLMSIAPSRAGLEELCTRDGRLVRAMPTGPHPPASTEGSGGSRR